MIKLGGLVSGTGFSKPQKTESIITESKWSGFATLTIDVSFEGFTAEEYSDIQHELEKFVDSTFSLHKGNIYVGRQGKSKAKVKSWNKED